MFVYIYCVVELIRGGNFRFVVVFIVEMDCYDCCGFMVFVFSFSDEFVTILNFFV